MRFHRKVLGTFFLAHVLSVWGWEVWIWKFTPAQRLKASNYFYYSFTPWATFRNVSSANWRWDLAEEPNLNLQAGVENEYQSDVAPGRKKNDLKYFTTVGIDF